jgi:hypothetical protein
VHLVVAPPHFGESTLLGAGFVVSAWVQITLAGAVVRRPTRCVLGATVLTSLVFIAVWAVSRTAGLPLGGDAGQPEAVTFVDGACVALEAIAAVLAGALIARPPKRAAGALSFMAAFGVVALMLERQLQRLGAGPADTCPYYSQGHTGTLIDTA